MAIFQVNYAPEKKMLQVTSRIFIDDLNKALKTKYAVTTHLGESAETTEDVALMNKYLSEHFTIKVNGNKKVLVYVNKELENNVVVGYYKINDIPKINSLSIQNTALMDVYADQQNIIQTTFNGKKQSLLLTKESVSGVLK